MQMIIDSRALDSSHIVSTWIARGGRNARRLTEGSTMGDGKELYVSRKTSPVALPLTAHIINKRVVGQVPHGISLFLNFLAIFPFCVNKPHVSPLKAMLYFQRPYRLYGNHSS